LAGISHAIGDASGAGRHEIDRIEAAAARRNGGSSKHLEHRATPAVALPSLDRSGNDREVESAGAGC
jgi:hypothetical protein